MNKNIKEKSIVLFNQVEYLNEEVKTMALNLAIYLAKAKNNSKELKQMEPDFIRLVNGTVKVVQDVARILNAANSLDGKVPELSKSPSGRDQVEIRLHAILDQCWKLNKSLSKLMACKDKI